MLKKIFLKKNILLWAGMLCVGFSVFAQNPYNIVMNIYDDPKTTMAFNWFTGVGVTGGEVQVMLGTNTVKTATNHPPKIITFATILKSHKPFKR